MLLFKTPKPLPDGQIELKNCTLLFFSKGAEAGLSKVPPIIMRAAEGATLKFDPPIVPNNVSLNQRQLVGGRLKGLITIRREPSRPGATDDLLITTRDVVLNKNRAHTPEGVQFRLGRSHGSGRDMEIFLTEEAGPNGALRTGTLRTLQLNRDVVMHLELGDGPLAPGAAGKQNPSDAPIKITCQGPFQYDFVRYAASFRQRVDVVRLGIGPSDLLNCELLTAFFEHGDAKSPAAEPPPAPGTSSKTSGLQVRVLEARGDPVTLRSPSRGIYVHCAGLDYWPAPAGAIGRLTAMGPGVVQGNLPNNPAGKYHAEWSRQFRFEPAGAEHVASLHGGAEVRFAGMGEVTANDRYDVEGKIVEEGQIQAWLFPAKTAPQSDRVATIKTVSLQNSTDAGGQSPLIGAGGGPAAGGETWQIQRVLAQGAVVIDSPQLTGTMGKLEAVIERPKAGAEPAPPAASPGDQAPLTAGQPPTQAAEQAPAAPQARRTSSQRFSARANEMLLTLVPNGKEFAVSGVTLDKAAHLEEITPAKAGSKPLVVQGDRLHVSDANTDQTRVTVAGRPGYLEAGGMILRGDAIELEKQTNRLWIDGPGRMTMPMEQDFNGRPVPRPQSMDVTWRGSMNFQSDVVVFERNVEAKSEQQFLRTEKLDAKLNRPVDFSNLNAGSRGASAAQPQLAVLRCYGPCFLESRDFDDKGQQSSFDQMEAFDLSLNRVNGDIGGLGPGTVTHVGPRDAQDSLTQPGAPAQPRPPARKKNVGGELAYLNVQFQRSITGNLNRREVTFGEPTKTVYGPVTHWDAKLNADDPASVGPDGIVLDAKQLTVRQMESRDKQQRGRFELVAGGNVLAEGTQFVARGHQVIYDEAKDQLILEGDGRSLAEIFYDGTSGGRREAKANKIVYAVKLQHVVVSGAQSVGIDVPQNKQTKPPATKLLGK